MISAQKVRDFPKSGKQNEKHNFIRLGNLLNVSITSNAHFHFFVQVKLLLIKTYKIHIGYQMVSEI